MPLRSSGHWNSKRPPMICRRGLTFFRISACLNSRINGSRMACQFVQKAGLISWAELASHQLVLLVTKTHTSTNYHEEAPSSDFMNGKFSLTPKGWFAVCLVACLLVIFGVYSGAVLIPVAAFCTAGIAAFDSMHIQLRRYKSGIAYGPVGLFVTCALIWPFAIIWYFIVRVRIARGTMQLKDEFRPRRHVA